MIGRASTGLHSDFAFIYSGTLGPQAQSNPSFAAGGDIRNRPESGCRRGRGTGVGVKQLHDAKAAQRLNSLKLSRFSPLKIIPTCSRARTSW